MAGTSRLKLSVARGVGALSRATGRGGGTSLPGKVLLKLDSDAIASLSAPLARSVVISATNGKTTTASLLAGVLRGAGVPVVHNHAGANMPGGIASALLQARPEELGGATGVFEADEAWAAALIESLNPNVIVLSNLFRDQLDRYGELETLAESWAAMISSLPAGTTVAINADDPLLAQLPGEDPRVRVVHFGIETGSCAESAPRHAADSKFCRRCGAPLIYSLVQLAHLGDYLCEGCGLARPALDIAATKIEPHGMDGSSIEIATPAGKFSVELPIPGLYNVYNALAATSAAHALGVAEADVADGLASARAVFGRVEKLEIRGQSVSLLLVKNPTGANEVLRTITAEAAPFDLWMALNDKVADGHDISWIWDADFEMLAGKTGRVTCSGTRAEELALRLAYAGVDRSSLQVDRGVERSFDSAIDSASRDSRALFALPTYTSLLELRTAIAKRGDAGDYWSASS